MNRGARHLPIFGDDTDRSSFLDLLGVAVSRHQVDIHAYALMGNHFHLLVGSSTTDLSRAMKGIGGSYTQRFNFKYGLDGPLFRGRFRSKPIASDSYLHEVVRYIHRNPIEGGAETADLGWTSHPAYAGFEPAPAWLSMDFILKRFDHDVDRFERFIMHNAQSLVGSPCSERRPETVRTMSLSDVERACGVGSDVERALISAGGRGIRHDTRQVCLLLARLHTEISTQSIARRYGYATASGARSALSRAIHRVETDAEFRLLVEQARRRLPATSSPT